MYFTQEDYIKIENWLQANSVKDTEFPEASSLSLNEQLTIIQRGENKRIKLEDLVSFLLSQSDSELDTSSTKPIQNKAVARAIYELQNRKVIEIVEELPSISNAKDNVVYILLDEVGEDNNLFTEWIKVNNTWEKVGEFKADIDLTLYLKIQDSPFEKGSGVNSAILKGTSNSATNKFATAFGEQTTASADRAFSEGLKTTASGANSHAEGLSTIAEGQNSHAEGNKCQAIGHHSHAEGNNNIANGSASHVEGSGTITKNNFEHAEGRYNFSNKDSDDWGGKNTIHSVGIGTSSNVRKNAHEILQNGKHYIYGIGGYNGNNILDLDGETVAAYDLATVINNKIELSDIPQSDYNQNDIDANDYIKNRPFYEDVILEEYHLNDTIELKLQHHSTIKIVVYDITDGILPTMILDSSNNYTARVNGSDQYYYANLNTETLILTIQESNIPQLDIKSVSQIKQLDEHFIPPAIARQSEITRLENRIAELENIIEQITIKVE